MANIFNKVLGAISSGTIKEVGNVIDGLSTSEAEKNQAKIALSQIVYTHDTKVIEAQKDVIIAEAQSESWLTRNWRPIVVMTFTALLVVRFLGITDHHIDEQLELRLMDIIELSLGGYVFTRGTEKVAKEVGKIVDATSLKKKDKAELLKEIYS